MLKNIIVILWVRLLKIYFGFLFLVFLKVIYSLIILIIIYLIKKLIIYWYIGILIVYVVGMRKGERDINLKFLNLILVNYFFCGELGFLI